MSAPFRFVPPSVPFAKELDALRCEVVRTFPELTSADTEALHAEVKAVRCDDGAWRLDRFYWSLQRKDTQAAGGLVADTLVVGGKRALRPRWYGFPSDPYLTDMAGHFAMLARDGAAVQTLRYVPLRRVTFRETDRRGRVRIGKFKRRSRFREAHGLIELVAQKMATSDVGFRVAEPLEIVEESGVFYQTALPGSNAADILVATGDAALAAEIGARHGELHRVGCDGLPRRDNRHWLGIARQDAALISLYRPEHAARLSDVLERMQRSVPPLDALVLCHGDMVCSQLLVDDGQWSILDFDLAHAGDGGRDLAMLVASLAYDMVALEPAVLADVETAILKGYAQSAPRPLDGGRLAWHRICAEIYFMALGLKKDRHLDADMARRWRVIEGLLARERVA